MAKKHLDNLEKNVNNHDNSGKITEIINTCYKNHEHCAKVVKIKKIMETRNKHEQL